MEITYRPLLSPTQYCPCDWRTSATHLNSLPHPRKTSPFYRSLFSPFSPLWINTSPQTTDNSPDVSVPSEQADINYRTSFDRQQKAEATEEELQVAKNTLYKPKGRWEWTHRVTFEDRLEEVPVRSNRRYTLCIRTAKIYQESITYIRKLWSRDRLREGFAREIKLHQKQLRPLHGASVLALIGVHANFDGVQMSYDTPHHSFWIEASPDMPDVLKRRCLDAYSQLHSQGVLHGSVELSNILIGGDGRVKIINFDQSKSTLPEADVRLEPAVQNDFRMEMREVHYKLDYNGARRKEMMAWENRDKPEVIQPLAGASSKIHRQQPYTISLEPPVDPLQWIVPEVWRPKRFVAPGQSVQQLEYHIQQFLLQVDEERGEGVDPPKFQARKRKRNDRNSGEPGEQASSKRVRFFATTRLDDGGTRDVTSPPPPGVKRRVPRLSPEEKHIRALSNHNKAKFGKCLVSDAHPYIPPLFDRREFLSFWESARARQRRQHPEPAEHSENVSGPSQQSLGKRREREVVESSESQLDGTPLSKRSKTNIRTSNTDGPPSASSRQDSTPRSSRYQTRSSFRLAQKSKSTSGSSRSSSSPLQTTPSDTSRVDDVDPLQSPLSQTSSSPRSPVASSSSLPSRTQKPMSSSATSNPVVTSESPRHMRSSRASSRRQPSPLTSARRSRSSGVRTRDVADQLALLTTTMGGSGQIASRSVTDSVGEFVVYYDPLAPPLPLRRRSALDNLRSAAERLPDTIFTAANTIARSFGLW